MNLIKCAVELINASIYSISINKSLKIQGIYLIPLFLISMIALYSYIVELISCREETVVILEFRIGFKKLQIDFF